MRARSFCSAWTSACLGCSSSARMLRPRPQGSERRALDEGCQRSRLYLVNISGSEIERDFRGKSRRFNLPMPRRFNLPMAPCSLIFVCSLSQCAMAGLQPAARPLGARASFSCRGTHYVYFSNSQMHTPRHIAKRHGAAHAKMQGERRWRARTTTGSCTHAHTQTHTRTHTHTYVHTHAHVHTLTHAHAHERGDDSRRRGVRGCGPRVWVARAARVWAEAVCGEGVGGEGGEGVGGEVRRGCGRRGAGRGCGRREWRGCGWPGRGRRGRRGRRGCGQCREWLRFEPSRAPMLVEEVDAQTAAGRPPRHVSPPHTLPAGLTLEEHVCSWKQLSKLLENACCTTHASVDSPQMRRRDAQLPDCDGSAWRAQLFHVDV